MPAATHFNRTPSHEEVAELKPARSDAVRPDAHRTPRIRLALGASRRSMVRQVVGEGGRIAAAGIGVGALWRRLSRRALRVEPVAALRVE